jgi:hypothetical protein
MVVFGRGFILQVRGEEVDSRQLKVERRRFTTEFAENAEGERKEAARPWLEMGGCGV